MTTYQPGSFFLAEIPGVTGFAINLGQALCGDGSRWSHAGLIVDTDGTCVEAEPHGARLGNVRAYAHTLISDGPVRQWALRWADQYPGASRVPIPEMRKKVVFQARKLLGTPYSALDYFALAALHLHLPSRWIRQRVESSGHMICSQLCDAVYLRAGIHLFADGRLSGDVLPADLAAWAEDWSARQ